MVNVWTNSDTSIPGICIFYRRNTVPLKNNKLSNKSNNLNGPGKLFLVKNVSLKMFHVVLSHYITFLKWKNNVKMENISMIARGQVDCVCVCGEVIDTSTKR